MCCIFIIGTWKISFMCSFNDFLPSTDVIKCRIRCSVMIIIVGELTGLWKKEFGLDIKYLKVLLRYFSEGTGEERL